jgi:hypothetical protein
MPAATGDIKRRRPSDNPILALMRSGHYKQMLPDLEFMIETEKLNEIERLHNEGYNMHQIVRCVKRYEWEVVIAIVHLAREGRLKRPIAFVQ